MYERPAAGAGFVKLVSDQESPVPANAGSGDFLFFIPVFNPPPLDRIHFYAGSSHRIRIPKVRPFSIRNLINRTPAFKAEPLPVRAGQVSGKRFRQYADLYHYLRFLSGQYFGKSYRLVPHGIADVRRRMPERVLKIIPVIRTLHFAEYSSRI